MRRHSLTAPAAPMPGASAAAPKSEWGALRKLVPYLWQWRWRVLVALGFLVAAKLANPAYSTVIQLINQVRKEADPGTIRSWT